jgi:hypothetical protein
MQIIAAITSPHEDDVIERVLRHLELWNPPWKRQRRARGPRPRALAFEPLAQERQEADLSEAIEAERSMDEYLVDPPSKDEIYTLHPCPAVAIAVEFLRLLLAKLPGGRPSMAPPEASTLSRRTQA